MALPIGRNEIVDRFGALPVFSEEIRIERILAAARTFLAITFLVILRLEPSEVPGHSGPTEGLLGLFVIYSLLIQGVLLFGNPPEQAFKICVHVADILWPMMMSLASTGTESPYYLYNVFVLSAAAYRWGLRETLVTAGASILLYTSEALVTPAQQGGAPVSMGGEFLLNRILLRDFNLLTLGFLVGYLGEEEKVLRAEASAAARITSRIQSAVGLRGAFREVFGELGTVFGSMKMLAIVHEATTGRLFLWETTRHSTGHLSPVAPVEVDQAQRSTYSLAPPAKAWYATRTSGSNGKKIFRLVTVDDLGRGIRGAMWAPPSTFLEAYPFRHALGVMQDFGEEWTGIVLLLDPQIKSTRSSAVNFLLSLSRYIGPALYNVYLGSRLRTRAGAVERARVARELHDGVIQSLISMEMQIDVLRRHESLTSNHVAGELQRLQTLLRQEVMNLRELMQQMSPVNIAPNQLLDFMASTVDRFRRDSGITANFTSTLQEVNMPPRVCTEVARILQEALVNIRKHSGAQNVLIRFGAEGGHWKLVIDDDGHGFDFSGRLSQDDLDTARRGPMVIKERVRSINGELAIDSVPGGGARLEIIFPQRTDG